MFSTLGILIGYLGYETFRRNEYYAYYNLGFTKKSLLLKVCIINMVLACIGLLVFQIFN